MDDQVGRFFESPASHALLRLLQVLVVDSLTKLSSGMDVAALVLEVLTPFCCIIFLLLTLIQLRFPP